MEIETIYKIFNDKNYDNYQKLSNKYKDDFTEFLVILEKFYYQELPLIDNKDRQLVFINNEIKINTKSLKLLLKSQNSNYSLTNIENEIIATSKIEDIDFKRESVRNILKGLAPKDEEEERIEGLKIGFDFISDKTNKINEENIHKLYMMSIGNYLDDENKLKDNNYYRHDSVFIVSSNLEHRGSDFNQLPLLMKSFVEFINREDEINDLIKAAIIHFYIAYIHPYFDGNGRMARLMHLWFLIQRGYESSLFIEFSSLIEKSRKAYYDSFKVIEKNERYSKRIDVTPFIFYIVDNVYNKLDKTNNNATIKRYEDCLKESLITAKEAKLFNFVLSFYGQNEFSTKQLEKDYGDVAYATIRAFVLKFTKLEILEYIPYKAKGKYKIKDF